MHELSESVCTLKRKQHVGGQNIRMLHNFGSKKGSGIRSKCSRKVMFFLWDFKW